MKIRRHIRAGDDEAKLLNLAINEIISQMSIEGDELSLTEHQWVEEIMRKTNGYFNYYYLIDNLREIEEKE